MEVFRRGATDVPLLLLDGIGFRFKELEQMVRELEPKPEILVLDYIQLISTEYRISKVEMLTEYVRQFKELAVKNNFVGILLSQINRGVENRAEKEPLLSELKGSGSLEECADTVLMLYWPWKNDTANDFNTFKIIVGKQRHGETGSIEVDFYPNLYFFKDKK
jgi:replicative DNA helicase